MQLGEPRMSCRKPCRQRSRECARDVLLAEQHVLPWQIFPQTTMAIHRSSKYCLPAPALPVRSHKKAEIEFQASQCYSELHESVCCRYAISGAPVPKNVSDPSCESGEGEHRWSPFFTGPPESQLDSHGPPKCDDDQNPSCDLVGMGSHYVVSTAVRLPVCQPGNNAGGRVDCLEQIYSRRLNTQERRPRRVGAKETRHSVSSCPTIPA
jgi:hypothetical protein